MYISIIKEVKKMNAKKKLSNASNNLFKKMIKKALTTDANNTTCISIYQPKVPADLKKFSKIEKE